MSGLALVLNVLRGIHMKTEICMLARNAHMNGQKYSASESVGDVAVFKDSHGQVLQGGDTNTVINDLKVKGASLIVKPGTRFKNTRDNVRLGSGNIL